MFRYLRRDHIQHCVPSNVSSGLATLPLSFVYVNNTPIKSRPTNKSLPTGELLNGKKPYQQIVSYFTTNTMSPDDIHDLGFKMLKELYPQVGDGILKFVIINCWNRPFVTKTITWYKIRHAGGQAHYYSRTGTLKQRSVKLDWLRFLCFNVPVRE